jgi:hypothetical protein
MTEADTGRVHPFGWVILGGLAATAFWWWRHGGNLGGRHLPTSVHELRGNLATLIDDRGRNWGEKLSARTHLWSERLRTNGQSKRIRVEGGD